MADPASAIIGTFAAFFILIFIVSILIFILVILAIVFWIFMIVDAAQREFKQENDKVLWILIVVLTGIIGAIIYYFMIKKPNKH